PAALAHAALVASLLVEALEPRLTRRALPQRRRRIRAREQLNGPRRIRGRKRRGGVVADRLPVARLRLARELGQVRPRAAPVGGRRGTTYGQTGQESQSNESHAL